MPHLPGQHYDVRLTAPDGYHAQRSYSVASSPLDEGEIELTIDLLDDGEVSPYFHEVVAGGRPGGAARPVHLLLRVARRVAGAARGRRLGRGAADGDAAPQAAHDARARHAARVLGALRRRRDLRGRARRRRACSPTRARRPRAGAATPATSTPSCCASRPTGAGSRSSADRTGSSRPRANCCSSSGWSPGDPHRALRPHGERLMEDRAEAARQVLRDLGVGTTGRRRR